MFNSDHHHTENNTAPEWPEVLALLQDINQNGTPDQQPPAQPPPSPRTASLITISSLAATTPHAFAARMEFLALEFRAAVVNGDILGPTAPVIPVLPIISTVDQYRRLFPVFGSLLAPMATLTTAILYYNGDDSDCCLIGAFADSTMVRGASDEAYLAIINAYDRLRDRGFMEAGE
jgi:hypothetical protein